MQPWSPAQDEFARIVAPTPRSYPGGAHPMAGRRSADSCSPPASASSRSSSPGSPAMSPAEPPNVYQIPNTAFDANTGPKGVIADAQSYDRARKRTFRQTIYGMTAALSNNVIGATEKLGASVRSGGRRSSDGTNPSDSEDEFMRSWREKRMAELKKGEQVRTRRQSPSKRRWGRLVAVDPIGYLDAVEKVAADTVVIVLIADPESSVSQAVENGISNLARKYDLTRFVKMHYTDAEMNAAAAPGILAYRNGELIANLIAIADEIPAHRGLSSAALEDLMKEHMPLM